jgi:cation diffusion facilitator family transporter
MDRPAHPSSSLEPRASTSETARLTAQVTWLSVLVGLTLMALKTAAWGFSGSTALLASAADSALDFIAALATFWAVRVAVKPADAEHRYGHGKAEAFASLLQAGLVFASAALIAREALANLLSPHPLHEEGWAVLIMGVSIAATLGLVQAQSWVIRRTRSLAIRGDRAHYLADLVSNAAAVFGVLAAKLSGDPRWDAAAGLVVGAWLIKGAIDVLRQASSELMDREVDEPARRRILELALNDPQVMGVHQFRTRASGPTLHVQMHMELEPHQTLAEAHDVVEAAESRILNVFPEMDLVIHADPFGLSEAHDRDFDGRSVGRFQSRNEG